MCAARRDPLCEPCGLEHVHFSTRIDRNNAIKKNLEEYFCPICKKMESSKLNIRKLILSDSLLYGAWDTKTEIKEHVDLEVLNGAKIKDLSNILKKYYLTSPEPIEVILIGGINNIQIGEKAYQVLNDIYDIKKMLKSHSPANKLSISLLSLLQS